MILINKKTLALFLVALPVISSAASTFNKQTDRADGVHNVKIDIQEDNLEDFKNAKIIASEYVKNKKYGALSIM
ncbi:hypothetical protein GJ686_00760 [Klebsiella variicola]|uniref:hypothetical protein n=1 Tax=Klebsiella variicola TaxID=244366 RepID=UPI0012DD1ACA|nr:hypothetical protein [Klebsiella variicola]MUM49019.1 hypothetical protein [Klebsiella variicola]MUM53098.1 hypothetical protein [Klebsiella variicola]